MTTGSECIKRISRELNGERIEVKIYTSNRSRSENDKEMDARAISAVHEAINRAKVTNKPIKNGADTYGQPQDYSIARSIFILPTSQNRHSSSLSVGK